MKKKRKSKSISTPNKSQTWYRKKCVAHAKQEAKERDGYICQRCGRSKEQGYQMHGSHNKSEGLYKSMSADMDNILTLCAICHFWWHENPLDSARWFKEKYPNLEKILRIRAQKPKSIDWKTAYMEQKFIDFMDKPLDIKIPF